MLHQLPDFILLKYLNEEYHWVSAASAKDLTNQILLRVFFTIKRTHSTTQ